jgi:hypothetical protein
MKIHPNNNPLSHTHTYIDNKLPQIIKSKTIMEIKIEITN